MTSSASRGGLLGHVTRQIGDLKILLTEPTDDNNAKALATTINNLDQRWTNYEKAVTDYVDSLASTDTETIEDEMMKLNQAREKVYDVKVMAKQRISDFNKKKLAAQAAQQQPKTQTQQQVLEKILDETRQQMAALQKAQADQMAILQKSQADQSAALVQATNLLANPVNPPAAPVPSGGAMLPALPQLARLPKLEIKKFAGDIKEWTTFWELFDREINSKIAIPDIEKFTYLRGYLKDEALLTIANLPTTGANYPVAVALLTDEYGDKKSIIQEHLQDLDNLSPVKNMQDLQSLKLLFLNIQSNVNALEALGMEIKKHGSVLATRLLKLIPFELQKKAAESDADVITDLPGFLDFFQAQIKIQERLNRLRAAQQPSSGGSSQAKGRSVTSTNQGAQTPTPPTAATLTVASTPAKRGRRERQPPRQCLYCPEVHYLNQCPVPLKKKMEALDKQRLCQKCLKKHESGEECKRSCFQCKGNHHQSICPTKDTKKDRSNQQSNKTVSCSAIGNGDQEDAHNRMDGSAQTLSTCSSTYKEVFLKTATVEVLGESGWHRAILLVDDGSQRSYVKGSFAEELKLEIIGEENLSVQAFGSESAHPAARHNLRQLYIKGTYPGADIVRIGALDHPYICGINPYKPTKFAKQLWESGHKMADDRLIKKDSQVPLLQILIGADNIFRIQNERVIHSSCGLRAYDSRIGWLLLGPSEIKTGGTVLSMMVRVDDQRPSLVTSRDKTGDDHNTVDRPVSTRSIQNRPVPTWSMRDTIGLLSQKDSSTTKEVTSVDPTFDLKLFWEIEHLGIMEKGDGVGENTDWEEFEKQIYRLDTGGYVVPYPFKPGMKELIPNLHNQTKARLMELLIKLNKCPELLRLYHGEFRSLIEKNFISEADPSYRGPQSHLSHRPVVRQDKETTKIRPVFDASARARGGVSLNQCLETGPNLNPDLFDVLLRFRTTRIAWMADIEQAFLNIHLTPEDTKIIRFLWVDDPFNEDLVIKTYQWNRVSFGLSCSPYLLRAVIKKHLEGFEDKYPDTTDQLKHQLYVDDYLGGADDQEDAEKAINETLLIFQNAELRMRKWVTNDAKLQETLVNKGLAKPLTGVLGQLVTDQENHKVLGVRWNNEEDYLYFDPTPIVEAAQETRDNATKRKILQISARVFDPLGLIGPTILMSKIIFQKLWEYEVKWDDPVPADVQSSWNNTMSGLQKLANIHIPRWVGTSKAALADTLQLHIFCDASETAYGAVAYVRLKLDDRTVVKLLCSRNKVAPMPKKKVSLPRIELLGCFLGAKLATTITTAIHNRTWSITLWSDSKVAIGWIKGDPTRWKPFVKNQVEKMATRVNPGWWKHCPGIFNPADLASRGASAEQLSDSQLWWEGPPWLVQDPNNWPDPLDTDQDKDVSRLLEEETRPQLLTTIAVCLQGPILDWNLDRINTFHKLIRRTAWILRYIRNRITGRPNRVENQARKAITCTAEKIIMVECLSAEEMREAELYIYRKLQRDRYQSVIDALKEGRKIKADQNLIVLRPAWDPVDRVIRVTGRVELALRSQNRPFPILIPFDHDVVNLLITATHRRLSHAGVRTTLAELREEMWIVKGRQQVKKILHRCVYCQKQQSRHFDELPAALPADRVEEVPRPFEVSGVDFAGPFFVRKGRPKKTQPSKIVAEEEEQSSDTESDHEIGEEETLLPTKRGKLPKGITKVYLLIISCAKTRAVHHELVRDMSATKFLLALRSFFARRGYGVTIYSDNAQTFKTAAKYLKLIQSNPDVNDWLANHMVTWKFSASLAPWWGGFWERMVRNFKDLFRKTYGRASLDIDELRTAFAEIEYAINSRPLTYVGEGMDDPAPITPLRLLIGPNSTTRMTPTFTPQESSAEVDRIRRLDNKRQAFVRHWTELWKKDYITDLSRFHVNGRVGRPIAVNEVVLIHDANLKRLMWKLGVVTELIPGRDGRIRAANVRVGSGNILNRAIQCLYPLEIRGKPFEPGRQEQSTNTTAPPEPTPPAEEPAILPMEEVPAITPPPISDLEKEPSMRSGSGGEDVGNRTWMPTGSTRSGRSVRPNRKYLD